MNCVSSGIKESTSPLTMEKSPSHLLLHTTKPESLRQPRLHFSQEDLQFQRGTLRQLEVPQVSWLMEAQPFCLTICQVKRL